MMKGLVIKLVTNSEFGSFIFIVTTIWSFDPDNALSFVSNAVGNC